MFESYYDLNGRDALELSLAQEGWAERGMHTPRLQRAGPQVEMVHETKVCEKTQWDGKCNATESETDLNVRVILQPKAPIEPVHIA